MAKSFNTLRDKMSSERREKNELRTQAMLLGMALKEVRQLRHLTQQQLADALGVSQAALSKMENQGDIQISTLQRILAAMGGELKLVARFPDSKEIVINQFTPVSSSSRRAISAG